LSWTMLDIMRMPALWPVCALQAFGCSGCPRIHRTVPANVKNWCRPNADLARTLLWSQEELIRRVFEHAALVDATILGNEFSLKELVGQ